MEYYYVEDLPDSCYECSCCHSKHYDHESKFEGEKFCGILNEDVEVYYYYGYSRPEFCPLRKLQERIGN